MEFGYLKMLVVSFVLGDLGAEWLELRVKLKLCFKLGSVSEQAAFKELREVHVWVERSEHFLFVLKLKQTVHGARGEVEVDLGSLAPVDLLVLVELVDKLCLDRVLFLINVRTAFNYRG